MSRMRALLVVAAMAPLAHARAGEGAARPPVQVRIVSAEASSGSRWVAGSLIARQRATLSTRIAAQVRAVHADEGSRIARGTLLVRLADDDVRGRLVAAEAALAAAAAHEKRIRAAFAERAATRTELEAAETQRALAQADVAAARSSLTYTELRAPFTGTVQTRHVQAGDFVGPGQPLVTLEASGLEIEATLSEEEARGLTIGQKLRFVAEARDGLAEVTALAPGGDAASHRRALRARVSGDAALWRSGSFVRVALPPRASAARDERVWVPRSALVARGDLTGVFVAVDGRAELRWIAPGEGAGEGVPVRAGLSRSDAVIDAPAALRDGDAVEIVR